MAGPGQTPGAAQRTPNTQATQPRIPQYDGAGDGTSQRTNPFGPSQGYDPSKPQQLEKTAAQIVGSRIDLPASAYHIAGKQVGNPFLSLNSQTFLSSLSSFQHDLLTIGYCHIAWSIRISNFPSGNFFDAILFRLQGWLRQEPISKPASNFAASTNPAVSNSLAVAVEFAANSISKF